MTVVWPIIALLFFLLAAYLLGKYSLVNQLKEQVAIHDFAIEYRNKVLEVLRSRSTEFDSATFQWLQLNADEIQSAMGETGVMQYMSQQLGRIVNDYPIILNEIPKLAADYLDRYTAATLEQALLRHIGFQQRQVKATRGAVENPATCIKLGIAQLLSVPLYILNLFGILERRTVGKLAASRPYQIGSGIITLIGIISGIVTIIQGFDQTKRAVVSGIQIVTGAPSDSIHHKESIHQQQPHAKDPVRTARPPKTQSRNKAVKS